MSDFEKLLPTEEEIRARGNGWMKLLETYENNPDEANDEIDFRFDDILDYEEDDYDNDNAGPLCEESKYDSDDSQNDTLNENKDKIILFIEQKKKCFFEKGLFDTLNFFGQNQGMNWMQQSNFSQSYVGSGNFGHTSVSHHLQNISVFTFSNNSQISFSNCSNNNLLMQPPPSNFFNPMLRNNSLQSICEIPTISQPQLDFKQRSLSTNSFRNNYKNSNISAIEDVIKCSSSRNKENVRKNVYSTSDSSSDSPQRNRVKKLKQYYKGNKTKVSPTTEYKTENFEISSESETEFINETVKPLKPECIPVEPTIVRNKVLNSSDPDKTITEGDTHPSRRHYNKTGKFRFFFYYLFLKIFANQISMLDF